MAIVADAPPLTARSVIASTLLGVSPPALPAAMLVRSGTLFGIAEGTIRVALSRMTAAGELAAADASYRLVGPALVARQQRQELSRAGARTKWDGTWLMRMVTDTDRDAAARTAFRRAATALRYAERREGVWLRPANLPDRHHETLHDAHAIVAKQSTGFHVIPDDDPNVLATTLWDLNAWATRATQLHRAIEHLTPALESARDNRDDALATLSPAFVVSAAALRWLQSDPLLPDVLLPNNWPGTPLRKSYETFDRAFKDTWRVWAANSQRDALRR